MEHHALDEVLPSVRVEHLRTGRMLEANRLALKRCNRLGSKERVRRPHDRDLAVDRLHVRDLFSEILTPADSRDATSLAEEVALWRDLPRRGDRNSVSKIHFFTFGNSGSL